MSRREEILAEMGISPLWLLKDRKAPEAQIAPSGWIELKQAVPACTACGLHKTRTQTVFGVGDENADWLLVGEAPGAEEDRLGDPFVGQAGKLLDNMLAAIGLNRRENIYIANVLKCRPPGNRNPEPDEVAKCTPFLLQQIGLIQPKLIVAMGRFAAQTLLGTDASIASLRGRTHTYAGVTLIVTYHPAYLLRNLPDKAKAWEDLVFAQKTMAGALMPFYEKGAVRIRYEEAGAGPPLLLLPGGGLNSTIARLTDPFDAIGEFKGEYRCIAADLRNANDGQSSGPLEVDRPWDAYTDDQLGLMDHLGIGKFMVLGFCIGGPMIWNLIRRAPNRIVAAVLAQPSGSRPEARDLFYDNNMKTWGPELRKRRPDISLEATDRFLTRMYRTDADFVFTVTRDFVRACSTPVLILPDDIPPHPYAVAMEAAMLAPNAEVSLYPWKEPKERIPLAVRQIRSFLRAHRP